MLSKCKAIVIKTINYSETSVVLTCYTDMYGIQTYMVNGVRSKKGAIRPSQLMPLTLIELEAYHQQNKNMQRIKELRCTPALKTLHFDMTKSAIGMFVSEIIYKIIREENQTDEALFGFLFSAIQLLDIKQKVTNFPAYFLLQLSKYLGFWPKGTYTATTNSFDWHEGEFKAFDPLNPSHIEPAMSQIIAELLTATFDNFDEVNVVYQKRIELHEHLLQFYQNHTDTLHEVKSHKVLAEVLR